MQLSCPVDRQDMIATNQVNMTPLSENSHITMAPQEGNHLLSLVSSLAADAPAEDDLAGNGSAKDGLTKDSSIPQGQR